MSEGRSAGQKLLNFPVKEEFLEEIDRAISSSRFSNRSEFIRQAILEKLQEMGISIPEAMASAPSRSGKVESTSTRKPPVISTKHLMELEEGAYKDDVEAITGKRPKGKGIPGGGFVNPKK